MPKRTAVVPDGPSWQAATPARQWRCPWHWRRGRTGSASSCCCARGRTPWAPRTAPEQHQRAARRGFWPSAHGGAGCKGRTEGSTLAQETWEQDNKKEKSRNWPWNEIGSGSGTYHVQPKSTQCSEPNPVHFFCGREHKIGIRIGNHVKNMRFGGEHSTQEILERETQRNQDLE